MICLLFATFLDIFGIFLEFVWGFAFSILFISFTSAPSLTSLIFTSSSWATHRTPQTHERGRTS